MKFLVVLFCIVFFFYLLSLVGRAMLRGWLERNTRNFQQTTKSKKPTKKEGEITIDKARFEDAKRIRGNVGDYVDYEEIKD